MTARKKKQSDSLAEECEMMSFMEAVEYLKKMDEWWAVRNASRDTIIQWAHHLYNHEKAKKNAKDDNHS